MCEFDYEKWYRKYHNDDVIDLRKYFMLQNFDTINKLGIKIKAKKYTRYEFEVLSLEILEYYKDYDMTIEELELVKDLEEKNVLQEEYDKLLRMVENVKEIYEC